MLIEDYLDEDSTLERAVIRLTRDAGRIRRCHTLDTSRYNVGEHTYNMMQMLLQLWHGPNVPLSLIQCIMMHDVPEIILGDIPAPAKWEFPEMAEEFAKAETHILRRFYPDRKIPSDLDIELTQWLKGLDWLELYLWSLEEYARGDSRCLLIAGRLRNHLKNLELPLEVLNFVVDVEVNGWAGLDVCKIFHDDLVKGKSVA